MDTNQRRGLILKGNMYKVILTLALPIMLNNLIQKLYNLVDAMWISKIIYFFIYASDGHI